MRERFPQHCVRDGEMGVFEPMAGYLQPERAIGAALEQAESRGARIRRHTDVRRIEPGLDRITITTADATHTAHHLVITVGAWFPVVNPGWFAPERFPVFFHEQPGGRLRYGFPTLDGREVKLAVHHEGQMAHPNTINRTVSQPDLEPLQEFVSQCLVGVEPVASRSIVCMYTNTPDRHFLVGPVPGLQNMTVLGGFSGHGFKVRLSYGRYRRRPCTAGRDGSLHRDFRAYTVWPQTAGCLRTRVDAMTPTYICI